MVLTIKKRERRRNMMTRPSGSEKRTVRKKIAHVRSIPSPMVDSMVEKLDGTRELINRAYAVFVALDENDQPSTVPPFSPQTEEEIKNAYLFFAPIDVLLLRLRTDAHSKIEPFAKADIVLQQIIGDTLTPEQQSNRFIRQIIPFLPNCKNIRGNRTLITLMLRKVFMDEGMRLEVSRKTDTFTDPSPRYENQLDMELGACYVGNTYDDSFMSYDIYYWSDDIADEHFLELIDEVEMLRGFLKDFFLSIEEDLVFNISHDDPPLRLSDEVFYNYLNYNTNI